MLQFFRGFFLFNALFGINGNVIMCFQERDEVMKNQISVSIFLNYIESRFES